MIPLRAKFHISTPVITKFTTLTAERLFNIRKKEIVAFSWDKQYEQVQDIKEQYRKMDNVPSMLVDYEGSLNAYKTANIAATKEKWMPNCTLCETDFINSLTIYLKTDITTSLRSDNYLLRIFAYMDRRVGKRTLIKIKDDVEKLPDWVKQFYQIRCEADGILFPPKETLENKQGMKSFFHIANGET